MRLFASISCSTVSAIALFVACGGKQTPTDLPPATSTSATSSESLQAPSPGEITPQDLCEHAYAIAVRDRPDQLSNFPSKDEAVKACVVDVTKTRDSDPKRYHCEAQCIVSSPDADAVERCGKMHHCD